ncbi:MAG: TspO protein [Bacteroidetes bacterium]|nr:TspO protein [Bacteroidota bacterium]|tara:strand:- start:5 stop:463 length:459 start_codon:yes stop_codon:yes gene_type:complete
MIIRVIIFLILNFGSLAISGYFTGDGVPSDWYQTINKAPWTPPGWAFGAAWATIMICFSFYMAMLWQNKKQKSHILSLFIIQWILNISWSPVFFYYHEVLAGLIIITSLTIVIGIFIYRFRFQMKYKSVFLLPYFLWLLIATSLNGYILLYN